MPKRATKRGTDRTPLDADADVLVCGASFAGLAVARELAGSGARVLVVDRYEVGERQTSACAAPTAWLHNLDLHDSVQQTFETLLIHTLRVGVGSFDPHDKVKEPTLRLAADEGVPAVRFQGNWIPHRLRPAVDARTFFVGDSAGHCLPTTAEGIRPALYFGLACGRELRAVVEGRRDGAEAMARYAAFSRGHRWKYEALFRVQQLVGAVNPHPRAMRAWLGML